MTYNSSKTGAQVDGAVDDVQAAKAASPTDTTAGRLLKVGDFGAGAAAGTTLLGTSNTPIQPNATNLILDSGANIGVGVINPTLPLQIKRTGLARIELDSETSNSDIIFNEGGNNNVGTIGSNNGSQDLAIRYGYHSGGNGALLIAQQSTERLRIDASGNLLLGGTSTPGVKVMYLANAATVPSSNPSGGGVLYVEGGALKYRGSSGTVTTIAPA